MPNSVAEEVNEILESAITEDRIPILKQKFKTISSVHDHLAKTREPHEIIDHLAKMDPSPNKMYTQRLVNWYHAGHFRQEDTHDVHNTLSIFHKNKHKMTEKDIGKYKTYGDFASAVHATTPVGPGSGDSKSERKHARIAGTEVMHDSPDLHVAHIKTIEAMRECGRGSRWCTYADSSGDQFNDYNKSGPLYYVKDKTANKKFLLHFETDQFHNTENQPVDTVKFAKKHPTMINLFHGKHYGMFTDRARAEREFLEK